MQEELQYKKMTETPTKKLVLQLGIPTIISMLITAIYNIADTFFVSQLGESASSAVGVVFSLMAVIQAVGFTFGMGAGSLISSKLGEKKNDEAQKIGSSSFYIAMIIGIMIMILSLIFIKPLLTFLGASDTNYDYAYNYATYIIFGFPVMVGSFVLNNILRAEGKSKLSMIGLTIGGILNIILDPIFIYLLNLGISGAAIATFISQTISFCILLSMYIFKKTIVRLSIKDLSNDMGMYFEVIKIGFPSLCRQGLASIATILINRAARDIGGDYAQSAISIVSKVFMVIFSISLGIGQGYQPVCGYNYFAKRYDRVKEALLFTFVFGTVVMFVLSVFFFIFAEQVIDFFIDSDEVIAIGKNALRFQCISMPLQSLNVISNMTFQSTRKKFRATLLSCCRQGIFFIPLVFILPSLFEITGIELVQAGSDFLTFIFTIPFFIHLMKEINSLIKKSNDEVRLQEQID